MLEVADLSAGYYLDLHIVQDVHVNVPDGAVIAVLGANGVGKSTLLKAIAGFLKPSKGTISVDGKSIAGLRAHQVISSGVVYIPQERGLFEHMTVLENLQLGAWSFRHDHRRVLSQLDTAYERFPLLFEKREQPAGRLSGGQQRMLEIARALMVDPKLLLIDEPTAGLSPRVAEEVSRTLISLRAEGRAILLVEQDIRWALDLADYIYVLDLGRNRDEGKADQFMNLRESFWW